jgi:hypothetical protein
MRLLRWLLRLDPPDQPLCDQLRAAWGTETTARIIHASADDRKVRIPQRRTFWRKAS